LRACRRAPRRGENRASGGGTRKQPSGILGRTIYILGTNGKTVQDAIARIEASHLGVAVQPIYRYVPVQDHAAPQGDPNANIGDPAQYVVSKFRLGESHRITRGNNVTIAVIDTEIDAHHPDLAGAVAGRYDAGCGATAPEAHGTGMGGAIASHDHLLGVGPNANAISQGAGVINMSFAGPRDPEHPDVDGEAPGIEGRQSPIRRRHCRTIGSAAKLRQRWCRTRPFARHPRDNTSGRERPVRANTRRVPATSSLAFIVRGTKQGEAACAVRQHAMPTSAAALTRPTTRQPRCGLS
jgi:hypothetical protein